MDWIFDNLQIVIAVAGAIAYWLNARNKDKAGEPADYDGDGEPDNVPRSGRALREQDDTMMTDEHTRRVQEEIRRKIAERAGGAGHSGGHTGHSHPPVPPPVPVARDWRREQASDARRQEVEHEAALVLARQRGRAEQLAALKARKAEAGREAKSVWTADALPAGGKSMKKGTPVMRDDLGLLAELRNARSLRKAIVMREVLGAPVGLR